MCIRDSYPTERIALYFSACRARLKSLSASDKWSDLACRFDVFACGFFERSYLACFIFFAAQSQARVHKQLMKSSRLIFASASPRRAQLLAQLSFKCEICPQYIDETRHEAESTERYVGRMAEEKAKSGRSLLLSQPGVLIAADTVVSLDDDVLAKPESEEEAESFLLRLAKRTHEVRSAVCMLASAEAGVVLSLIHI